MNVELVGAVEDGYLVQVFDLTGKLVEVPVQQLSPTHYRMNTQRLRAGNYAVVLQGEHHALRKLFVVQ